MKKKFLFYLITLCTLSYVFTGCSGNTDVNDNVLSSDTSKLLTNIYENGILKDFTEMIALVTEHDLTLKQLKDNPTSESLEKAIEEDKKLNIFWDGIEIYRQQLLRLTYENIQFFPVNTTAVLEIVNNSDPLDDEFFDRQSDSFKGLLANSYLLNTFDVDDFKNQPRYTDYLRGNLSHVKENILELEIYWKGQGDIFVSAVGRGLDQSVNSLINIYVNLLETIKLIKLEKPISSQDAALIESPYNDISIQLIRSNLKALKTSFNGSFQNSNTNYGFDDYLKALDREDLNVEVNTKIDEAIEASLKINNFKDIVTNNNQAVNTLTKKVSDILVLFSVDVSSALDVTVTFTDNDGD